MAKDPFDRYLGKIQKSLAAGNSTEHTHRPALQELLASLAHDVVGRHVTVVNEPKRIACGAPDLIISAGEIPLGYVEAKDVGESLSQVEQTQQLARYFDGLSNVVLTDYLEFRWYVEGEHRLTATLAKPDGKGLKKRETGREDVTNLLTAFLQSNTPTVKGPEELAGRMAGVGRLIRDSIARALSSEKDTGSLHEQMAGFREVLLHDLTEPQFADMYAQTLCYGLFAARCNTVELPFTRQHAAYDLPKTNPFLRKMFSQVAGPELDERIVWAVDDLAELLNRANMPAILKNFGKHTRQEDPVVHFYETFLKAYDPTMREARGVYYTPEPVVSYIVKSVDHILRTTFKLPKGLADSSTTSVRNAGGKANIQCHKVILLDPAVGTGTFLYSVVELIHARLADNAGAWSGYVSKHLLPRMFGFELLMAPYAVAHMKLGLQLAETGYDFAADERLRVYLTNTLEEAHQLANLPLFAKWLAAEANAASSVKQSAPVMVVLGNPPYSGHSGNTGQWINDLLRGKDTSSGQSTSNYFEVDGKPLKERNSKWLNDDYVKFIRFAQWRIEQTGYGILAFITNHGYLDNPTFRGMRQSLLTTFDEIFILDLHGNKKRQERGPNGSADDNVFDIQQGVAIGLFVKGSATKASAAALAKVSHAHLWGPRGEARVVGRKKASLGKYSWLSANDVSTTEWQAVSPQSPYYLLIPQSSEVAAEYEKCWKMTDIMPVNVLGFQTHRDHFAIDFDVQRLRSRLVDLRGAQSSDDDLRTTFELKDNRDWKLAAARGALRNDMNWEDHLVPCLYRPFDRRWCYFSYVAMDYPRKELLENVKGRDNWSLLLPRQLGTEGWSHVMVTDTVAESCVISSKTKEQNYVFPLYVYQGPPAGLFDKGDDDSNGRRVNFNPMFVEHCEQQLGLGFDAGGSGKGVATFGPQDLLGYMYSVLHSGQYRERYAELLRLDFPRIGITSDKRLFRALARLGTELVELHLMRSDKKPLTRFPVAGGDVVDHPRYSPPSDAAAVGRVWINETQYFDRVTPEMWGYTVGGHQPAQKWLKDRKGRRLSYDDITAYQYLLSACSHTSQLSGEIDAVIAKYGGWPLQ